MLTSLELSLFGRSRKQETMTTLGAALYTGFFAVAALWLFLTSDTPVDQVQPDGAGQPQDLSNSTSAAAAPVGSKPMVVTHSSQ